MKTGKYNLRQIFANKDILKFVVPEIQRDYVWNEDMVSGLLSSIFEDFIKFEFGKIPEVGWAEESDLNEPFSIWYKEQQFASNIGFIYAYSDPEIQGKHFIIDGQQRLTTLLILILALVNRNEDVKDKFKKTFLIDGMVRFEYNVRESAHMFLTKFVQYILENDENKRPISDQSWWLSNYKYDKTISAIANNFEVINNLLDDLELDEFRLFDYVSDYVLFWYFNTNLSEQGEELYIYMNARGESMQDHENLKAELIASIHQGFPQPKNHNGSDSFSVNDLKKIWAEAWESWNDLFWKKRNPSKNKNSDDGFNEFISCIAGLENYLNDKKLFLKKSEFDREIKAKQSNVLYKIQLKALSQNNLPRIENYLTGLFFFNAHKEKFRENYLYSDWIVKCDDLIWNTLNILKTNWFADLSDANNGIEHNRMVLLWTILYYLANINTETADVDEVFRFIRIVWLRYHNYNRSVIGIKEFVQDSISQGVWDFKANLYQEEKIKHHFLVSQPLEVIKQIEACIWEIEDHKLNIGGNKAINSSHLIDYAASPSLEYLTKIKNTFFAIFPNASHSNEHRTVQILLLFYGNYWTRVSPQSYKNYKFNDWERTIRELDGSAFKAFFYDCLNQDSFNLNELYRYKTLQFLNSIESLSAVDKWEDQVKVYAIILGKNLWSLGDYLHVYTGKVKSRLFENAIVMYKGGRDERSSYHQIYDLPEYANFDKETLLKKCSSLN